MKLEPLKQWVCDTCGQVIQKPEDGYLQYNRVDGKITDFVIVHHFTESPLHGENGCYRYDCDDSLSNFIGERGIIEFTSLLDPGPHFCDEYIPQISNFRSYAEIIRRLYIPYYEEARLYWADAESDGYFDTVNEIYMYLPSTLKRLIEQYKDY